MNSTHQLVVPEQFTSLLGHEGYPFDFEQVWSWLEYPSRRTARRILSMHCKKDQDFLVKRIDKKQTVFLSSIGFQKFCIVSTTLKGKEVADYFIVPPINYQLASLRVENNTQEQNECFSVENNSD